MHLNNNVVIFSHQQRRKSLDFLSRPRLMFLSSRHRQDYVTAK